MNMVTKFPKVLLLITVTPLLFAASCHKESTTPCSGYTPYSFKVTSEWNTQQEVYHIGDTFSLTSTFSKNLTNYSTPNSMMYPKNRTGNKDRNFNL